MLLGSKRGIRRSGDAHLIDDGHVGCPVKGRDVDVSECYGCSALADIVKAPGDDEGYVICRSPAARDPLAGRATPPWF